MDRVTIRDAIRRTGYTRQQLRTMVERGRIRYQRRGARLYLHGDDIAVLEAAEWQGAAVAQAGEA